MLLQYLPCTFWKMRAWLSTLLCLTTSGMMCLPCTDGHGLGARKNVVQFPERVCGVTSNVSIPKHLSVNVQSQPKFTNCNQFPSRKAIAALSHGTQTPAWNLSCWVLPVISKVCQLHKVCLCLLLFGNHPQVTLKLVWTVPHQCKANAFPTSPMHWLNAILTATLLGQLDSSMYLLRAPTVWKTVLRRE